MDDKLARKLQQLLPYIIITGLIFLLLPLFMIGAKESAATYIIQIGVFPLTALGCGMHYRVRKGGRDISVCFPAMFFYALAALFYGMWSDSWITVAIYLVGYFICGYLGVMLGDIVKKDKKAPATPKPEQRSGHRRPQRVNIKEEPAAAKDFVAEDPDLDMSLDTSTTSDDIEAILNEIHSRKQ